MTKCKTCGADLGTLNVLRVIHNSDTNHTAVPENQPTPPPLISVEVKL